MKLNRIDLQVSDVSRARAFHMGFILPIELKVRAAYERLKSDPNATIGKHTNP